MEKITSYLDRLYPSPKCALDFSTPYELLVAVILSAQCTDKRVNIVTKELFKIANTPEKMINLGIEKLKEIIHPCGFFNNKSKAIIDTSNDLINKFDGQVPSTMEDLTSLKGVGRKTANVVSSVLFGANRIGVDTHVFRVTNRLGLVNAKTPLEVERQWVSNFPEYQNHDTHFKLVLFGRYHCKAQNPNCKDCELKDMCQFYKNKNK